MGIYRGRNISWTAVCYTSYTCRCASRWRIGILRKIHFCGNRRIFFLFFVAIIVSHVRFTRLPEVFLERANTEFFHSNLDNSDLRIRSVDNIEIKISKDKYGRAYSYGKLTFEVDGRLYVFKKVDNPEAAKQTITEIKQSLLWWKQLSISFKRKWKQQKKRHWCDGFFCFGYKTCRERSELNSVARACLRKGGASVVTVTSSATLWRCEATKAWGGKGLWAVDLWRLWVKLWLYFGGLVVGNRTRSKNERASDSFVKKTRSEWTEWFLRREQQTQE